MSVYIKIKNAVLNDPPKSPIYLQIESPSAILKTQETPSSKNPFWDSSFICSIRERYLHFRIRLNSSFPGENQNKSIAVGQLPFQYFEHEPDKESLLRLQLVSETPKNQFKKQGFLDLVVFYKPNKNYVGQMEFYEFGEIGTYTSPKYKANHVEVTNKNYPLHFSNPSSNEPLKPLYKGPCKNKNLFSCCDQPVRNNEYQIIEPHYFN